MTSRNSALTKDMALLIDIGFSVPCDWCLQETVKFIGGIQPSTAEENSRADENRCRKKKQKKGAVKTEAQRGSDDERDKTLDGL